MKILLLFISFLFLGHSYATHAVGGRISYRPTGNINEYEITFTAYRDCGGVDLSLNEHVSISNNCSFNDTTFRLTRTNIIEISQLCPSSLPFTECWGIGNISGTEKHIYSGIFTLPGICNEWTLSWVKANRTNSINLINSGARALYIETKLNNLDYQNNSSPIVSNCISGASLLPKSK